jgi:hypothetical protein
MTIPKVSDPNNTHAYSYDCFDVFSIVCGHYDSCALCVGTMPCLGLPSVPSMWALCLALPCLALPCLALPCLA